MATDARWDMAFRRNNVRTFTIRLKGVDLTGKTMRQQVRLAPDTPGAPVIALETVTSATAEGLRLAAVEVVDGAPVSTIIGRYNLTTMRDKLPYGGEVGDDYPMVHEIEIDGKTRFYGRWVARATVLDSEAAPLQREPLAGVQRGLVSADTVEISATISADEAIEVTLDGAGDLGPLLGSAQTAAAAAQQALAMVQHATKTLYSDAVLGRMQAPVAGLKAANNTFLIGPIPAADFVRSVEFASNGAGTFQLARYTLADGIYTRQAASAVVTINDAGAKTLTSADYGEFPVQAGDYIGFYGNGPLSYTASTATDTFAWKQMAAGLPASGAATDGNIASRIEVRITVSKQVVSASGFSALQAAAAALQSTVSADSLIVAGLSRTGVTQTIGRTSEPVTGSSANSATVIFATPIAKDGRLKVETFAGEPSTMKVGRYTLSGTTVTLVASYTYTLAAGGLQTVATDIPVKAGELIAVQGAASFTYTGTNDAGGYYTTAAGMPASGTVQSAKLTTNSFQVRLSVTTTTPIVTADSFQALQEAVAAGGGSGSSPASGPILPLSQPNRIPLPTPDGWSGLLSYGQSLSSAWLSVPPISTAQPYSNLTFGSGPKSGKAGNTYNAGNTSPGTSTSKPLVEDTAAADGAGSAGETPCSGAANTFVELAFINNGVDPAANVVFASAPGHGSYRITQLGKSSAWYANFLDHVRDARALAVAAGKTYRVDAVSWMQGEANTTASDTVATYQSLLLQLQTDIDADVRAITGQAEPVHLFVYQTATTASTSRTNLDVPTLGQFGAVNARPELIHFVAPVVHLPPATDNVHLSAVAELWYGRMLGRAIYQAVYEARQPDCVWPLRAYAKGNVLSVKFRAPRLPLVLDPATFGAVTDMGFKVSDDTGALTLSSIAIGSDGASVTMTLNRALGANPIIRHGLDYTSAANTFQMSKNGCLRDSTPEKTTIGGIARPLWHVAPAFQLPIRVLAAES
ncbi:sialate O-acetylesterase [Sphingomonas desiccabilis]|uniref:Sialate O-acetylesterase domain-containing protein n=1 Tax=Sphingomonas desiccabilis TaxID=429134 RepID=A0A4Q2J1I9_9SPHN|nr:sialate O-acetylesterase [Sphingomonas desiccabilis]MBB3910828.1 hypothetical protein [Sphingomonas desiccabilis]RXZ35434.1 hypothetical protein EO081_07405 [Sphingomonas desiccabilis]